MNQSKIYPGFWHAVVLCVLFVSIQTGLSTPLVVIDMMFKLQLMSHPVLAAVINLLSFVSVILIARLIGRPDFSEVFSVRRVPLMSLAAVVVAGLGGVIVLSELDNLVRLVLPMPAWIVQLFEELTSMDKHPLAGLFLLVVVAPATEEPLFRGLIIRGFLTRFNPATAFLLSAVLFGAVHLNPWQFVSASCLGLIFAWWYARTRSLIPSLVGHALVNAMAVVHTRLPFEIPGFNSDSPLGGSEFQPWWFDLLGLGLLILGLWMFHRATATLAPPCESVDAAEPVPVPAPLPSPSSGESTGPTQEPTP